MVNFFTQVLTDLLDTGPTEAAAVITGIYSVYLSKKANILLYPIGLISTSLFVYLYYKAGLFADASVNAYFSIMGIIGWYAWHKKVQSNQPEIKNNTNRQNLFSICFFAVVMMGLYFILKTYTTSNVALADAFVAATSYTAMYLMNQKKIQHWHWWILTNIVSIPLNYVKGYAFASVQYIVLLVLAIIGLLTWKKLWHEQAKQAI